MCIFASGVSGKAIKSYTGISFVFHNHIVKINEAVPAYMDIGMYEENESIPYSQSWNLIYALQEALKRFEDEKGICKKLKRHMIMLKKLLLIWV